MSLPENQANANLPFSYLRPLSCRAHSLAQPRPQLSSNGEIHVWQMNLSGTCPQDLERVLTHADMQRAGKFVFECDRNRFLSARYGLRQILSTYTETEPQRLPIIFSTLGKPMLAPPYNLGFNLSHSGEYALLAIGCATEIGIDIEKIRLPPDVRYLAESVLSVEELLALAHVPAENLPVAFITCWTRKEAYLKAIGVGLTMEPKSITVGFEPDRRRICIECMPGSFVEIMTIILGPEYIASIAVVGGYSDLNVHTYLHEI